MLSIMAVTKQHERVQGLSLEDIRLRYEAYEWFWIDFDQPSDEEIGLLETMFHFHPLAIEDCLHRLQRPKLDHYGETHFFVLHSLQPETLFVHEVNLFIHERFIVSFHMQPSPELGAAMAKMMASTKGLHSCTLHGAYLVMDELVDRYFPAMYALDDQLAEKEIDDTSRSGTALLDEIFAIRAKLLHLRKTIMPMRDLLYRLLSSDRIEGLNEQRAFFADVHDHLLKLSEMLDASREMTADLRDSYISYSSNRMNGIMKTLTVITTIFMPLTFIAGLYGMNFDQMPELHMRWGYFGVLAVMAILGGCMFLWFKRKGWFD
ncbi:magnesium/cobalt transporter CorA [Paenibacillus sp. MMS18-CY102]|uniref:magnesium/cobalt transporter CorA n=1 Tax=Paenibacillus sp. MMS18-CY102 TaxID=2682849 RepID=UPI001365D435|nr:magnesium/cobalt transporter CorA [Paenibacillus sp. MMS18-CY102]MWC31217.1 magnesium/cobalt transporter CorA [Paenibacillus sp. MMS18-CY102]